MAEKKDNQDRHLSRIEYEIEHEEERQTLLSAHCTKVFGAISRPFCAKSHPLPDEASRWRRLGQMFLFPPSGVVGAILLVISMLFLWWAVLICVLDGKDAWPGGNIFGLLVLFISAWCGGYIIQPTTLPPLLGMLIVGGILRNVPHISFAEDISPDWVSAIRSLALTIILTRAGLGLDPVALRRMSCTVLRLAFIPSLVEAAVEGVTSKFVLDLSWPCAFMLAFILAAVSPAVIVPSLLNLSDKGYGIDKGIPTLIVAACSLDTVIAITGFGIFFAVSFSEGNLAWMILQGPVEAVAGVAYGAVTGSILWYLPQKSSKHRLLFRTVMLLGCGMLAVFGSTAVNLSGCGPLGCVSVSFVAGYKWRKEYQETGEKNPIEEVFSVLWLIFQPLMFGLIGASVDVSELNGDTVGYGVLIIAFGVFSRMVLSLLSVLRTNLNTKEKIFITLSSIPKATVQAAVGAIALDYALKKDDVEYIKIGHKILTIAVLAIIICAPIGSVVISLVGRRLLHKVDLEEWKDREAQRMKAKRGKKENGVANDPIQVSSEM